MMDFDPSVVWNADVTPLIRSSSEFESFLPFSFLLSSDALLLITIFLVAKPWITSFADKLLRSENMEDVVTVAEDDGFAEAMPTLISDTFPADWDIESLDVAISLEPDVPGYGGGGGSLSEIIKFKWFRAQTHKGNLIE